MSVILTRQRCAIPLQYPGLLGWYDAYDPNGDGTMPSDGSSLQTWVDKSGNRLNATQLTGSQQPQFAQNIFPGTPGIYFTHALSQYYDTDPVNLTDSCTLFCVIDSQSTNTYSIFDISTVALPEFNLSSGANQLGGGNYDGIANRGFSWFPADTFTPHIVCLRYDSVGGFCDIFIDNISNSVANANVSAAGLIGRRIGGHPVAPVSFDGVMFELFFYEGALTDNQVTRNLRYMGNKWGVQAP